jgi:hypothetical protein
MDQTSYQKKALECLLAANRVSDLGERLKLLAIAQQFMVLAAHVGARMESWMGHGSGEKPIQQRPTA